MRKTEALKLKRGDWIRYGDSNWGQRVTRWRLGRVAHVTARGGIKLDTGEWVPYHYVLHKETGGSAKLSAQIRRAC